jgi:hypothetical protein
MIALLWLVLAILASPFKSKSSWGEGHLRRILRAYARYYNDIRTHRSLDKDAPAFCPIQRIGNITSQAILGELHHRYVRFRFSVHTRVNSSRAPNDDPTLIE